MKALYAHIEIWIYRLLFVSFFLPPKIQTWVIILTCVLISINAFQQKIFLRKSELLAAFLLGGGYLFYVAYIPLTPSEQLSILQSLLERKIALFILPFIVPLMFTLASKSIVEELKWFVIANMVHGILLNAIVLFNSILHSEPLGSHVIYRLNFESVSGLHPTYYGMYICFSAAIMFYHQAWAQLKAWKLLLGHTLLLTLLLLLSPKISLLILGLLYAYFFFFVLTIRPLKKIILVASTLAIMLVFYVALPFFHDRIGEVFKFFSGQQMNAIDNSLLFRQLIFQIDLNILKDSWLLGIGPVKLQEYLDMAYFNVSYITKQMVASYNTHNEYLNQWICFGFAGFLYFISIYVLHIRKALSQKNSLYLSFLVIVMLSSLTENILSRQGGIIFVAFFGALFYTNSNDK